MRLPKRIHLALPLAIGILVDAGAESPPRQTEPHLVSPFRGTIHVVPPRKGIDFKIRIANVPENIDPGIFAPRR